MGPNSQLFSCETAASLVSPFVGLLFFIPHLAFALTLAFQGLHTPKKEITKHCLKFSVIGT